MIFYIVLSCLCFSCLTPNFLINVLQKVKAARHTLPSLLYVPDMLAWWDLVDEAARVVFMSLLRGLDRSVHLLILATASCNFADVPGEVNYTDYDISEKSRNYI